MAATSFNDTWTIRDALGWTKGFLESKGDEHPRLSAEWLLSQATGLSRVELYVNYDRPLSMQERDVLREGVRRRAKGEPLQYVTGEVAWRHMVVKVERGVLIPRPETELLVEQALPLMEAAVAERGEALVCDLCTGSGVVGLACALEQPDARVIATDIAPEAITLASRNAEALGLQERFEAIECDLAEGVPGEMLGSFDLLLSNPPYIPSSLMKELPSEVADFEPALALDGGQDGLDIFRRILDAVPQLLRADGTLICELHEDCLDAAAALCEAAGMHDVAVLNDLTGRPRFIRATR